MRLDEFQVRSALRGIDPTLRVDRVWAGAEFLYYIIEQPGAREEDQPIRVETGKIWEGCSMHMVEHLCANEGDWWEAWTSIKKNNWDKRQLLKEQQALQLEEMAREWQRNTGTVRQYFT
jgi:hypothetical protein